MTVTAQPRWTHVNVGAKPSEQTIADAYVYLLGRALVVRQEAIDRNEPGFAYNAIKYNPLGSAELYLVNPNLDLAQLEAWIAVDDNSIVLLDVPEIEGRYYTAQVLDEWGEVIVNINERTFPTRPFGRYALVTPDSTAEIPNDAARIELHSNKAKLLGRVELKGDRDGAVRLQRQFKLTTLGVPVVTTPPTIPIFHDKELIGAELFADVDATLASALDVSPVAAEMQQKTRAVAAYVGSSNKARAAIDAQVHELVPELHEYAVTKRAPSRNHWMGGGVTGNYGRNYWLRTAVNLVGIWANTPDEVVYFVASRDGEDKPLDGSNSYVMHFPADRLPQSVVDCCWSVSLVGPDCHVAPNALDRFNFNTYSLLQEQPDGSLVIGIGPIPVAGVPESNWLPSPAGTPFSLTLRTYVPKDAVTRGVWLPAPVTRVSSDAAGRTLDTRLGRLEFTHDFANGYPTTETIEKLYDERDFQRACQAYLWALPAVSFAQWQRAQSVFGAGSGGIVEFTTYDGKLGILTANATTPYYVGFADLSTGPLVIEMPSSGVRGSLTDAWQRNIPDSEAPAKYLVLAPGQPQPDEVDGYEVRRSPTFNILFGIRITVTDPKQARAVLAQLRIYPYVQRATRASARIVSGSGKAWSGMPPRGLEYWQRLAQVIEREPVEERDVFFHAMLEPLGIEKDVPFAPNARQAKLLTEAALVGEAMAKVNSATRRFVNALYRPHTHWEAALLMDADHPDRFWDLLDQRSAWFYEAVTAAPSMAPKRPGPSSAYLGAYKDKAGNWLDGAATYRLHVPAKPPVELFWSVTLYDVDTRCLLQNEQKIADRSSRMSLRANADGSVDIFCGPRAPIGFESNWIPTVPGKNWFAYFRFYEPTSAYFERTWPLPDFEAL